MKAINESSLSLFGNINLIGGKVVQAMLRGMKAVGGDTTALDFFIKNRACQKAVATLIMERHEAYKKRQGKNKKEPQPFI